MFPPSVPCPRLKGTAVPGLQRDVGQCPLGGPVPKKQLLNEQFPSLHAEELLPSSPPDQLCFACENDGLRMQ